MQMNTSPNTPSPAFSIGDTRKLVGDLFQHNGLVYWIDFLLCWSMGMFIYAHGRTYAAKLYLADFDTNWKVDWMYIPGDRATLWLLYLLFTIIAALLYYRIAMFIHEIVHMRGRNLIAFRFVWNALCGIPFLVPSFVYYPHLDHHRRRHYGTQQDGEYLPLGQRAPWQILLYLMHPLVVPPLVFIRFLFFTPLAWILPGFRSLVHKRCSSMIIDPTYCRPFDDPMTKRIFYLQEFFCFLWLLTLVSVVWFSKSTLPWPFFIQSYTTAVIILSLNALRTLGAHRWTNDKDQMSFEEQLLDSVNYPYNPILGEIWAPVGLRFHALHHLFPNIPYYNLGKAHRRLTDLLPVESIYHQTSQTTLTKQLLDLWRRSKQSSIRNRPKTALDGSVPDSQQ